MPNWKAPGPDLVQGFWLKNFATLHERIAEQLQVCLELGRTPTWMTKGRTLLTLKVVTKGNIQSNYMPITCLPLMWKLLTGTISAEIYAFLDDRNLLPEEQKRCRKKARGTHDLLFIDKVVLTHARTNQRNLAMTWIDYKKAYDMVPHSWIEECLNTFGIAENIKKLLRESVKNWRTELTSGSNVFGEVHIQRGIFQGDALSPFLFVIAMMIPLNLLFRKARFAYDVNGKRINHLMFMDARSEQGLESLVHTVRIFSEDIGMDFGIDKCAKLMLRRGKVTASDGIKLPEGREIKSLDEGCSYKYLGIRRLIGLCTKK